MYNTYHFSELVTTRQSYSFTSCWAIHQKYFLFSPLIFSYMVSVGLIDRLGEYFLSVTGPIEDMSVTQLVLGGLNLLVATTAFLHSRSGSEHGAVSVHVLCMCMYGTCVMC